MTYTWAEPFAGGAACALRLVGGRDLVTPVAFMGGKRRYARAILDAQGVPHGPPARVLLADAGPWGWVWPLLLKGEDAAKVAASLRSWAGEHPRDLWQRLAAQPPAEEPHERAAQWLWLQARSASGVPIWWDGWRHVAGSGKPATDRGEDMHQAQRAEWLASDGRGQPRPAGARAIGGRWEKGNEGRVQDATNGQRGAWRQSDHDTGRDMTAGQSGRGWRFDARPGDVNPDRLAGQAGWGMCKSDGRTEQAASQKGTSHGRTGGMVNPCTIATRIEALAESFAGVDVQVHHGDAHAHAEALGIARRLWWSDREECDCVDCDGTWCVWCLEHHGRRPCPVEEEAKASAPRLLLGAAYVYLDPPYQGATGYGWDMPRAEVLALARRWADAGAVVAVSEAEPLPLEGWHHLELTREGGKPEFLTLSRAPVRVPARQGALFT